MSATMSDAPKRTVARAVADLTEGTILASVQIAAPAERIFRALTSEEVLNWWGADDAYRTTEWSADVRVGGHWRAGGRMPDGSPYAVEGEYLEVSRPHRLVHTWKPDWDGGHVTTVTYQLDESPGGTKVTLRHDGFRGHAESCQSHADGWESVLGWLSGHVSDQRKESKFFVCRLHGPRPSFPADMTQAEGQVMQQHMAYWTDLMQKGLAVAFGPVLDPAGTWGLGLLEAENEEQVRAIVGRDPTVLSGLGFRLEPCPMMMAVVRPA